MTGPSLHSRIASSIVRFLLVFAVAGTTDSVAQGNGTTFTDLWAIEGKPGKGHLIFHQEPVAFLTSFTYSGDRTPYWLSATLVRGPDAANGVTYRGEVFETNGPPFDAASDHATVVYRKVGEATFTSSGLTAQLQYTKDGTVVSEQLTRFTLHNLDISGMYISGVAYETRNCSSPALNGQRFELYGLTTVTQPPGQLNIVVQGENTTCTFWGNYGQTGSLGNASGGAMSCADGTLGNLQIGALQQTVAGWTAVFRARTAVCELDGRIGAITY